MNNTSIISEIHRVNNYFSPVDCKLLQYQFQFCRLSQIETSLVRYFNPIIGCRGETSGWHWCDRVWFVHAAEFDMWTAYFTSYYRLSDEKWKYRGQTCSFSKLTSTLHPFFSHELLILSSICSSVIKCSL